jgi:hypothetical protein
LVGFDPEQGDDKGGQTDDVSPVHVVDRLGRPSATGGDTFPFNHLMTFVVYSGADYTLYIERTAHECQVSSVVVVAGLFPTGCAGGGRGDVLVVMPDEVPFRVGPAFPGSDVLVLYFGGTDRPGRATCNVNECRLLGLVGVTSLPALLSAEGFEHTEARRGVNLGQGHLQGFESWERKYGGWLDHSAFAVHSGGADAAARYTESPGSEIYAPSYSMGVAVNINPVSGSASWTGVMVGAT